MFSSICQAPAREVSSRDAISVRKSAVTCKHKRWTGICYRRGIKSSWGRIYSHHSPGRTFNNTALLLLDSRGLATLQYNISVLAQISYLYTSMESKQFIYSCWLQLLNLSSLETCQLLVWGCFEVGGGKLLCNISSSLPCKFPSSQAPCLLHCNILPSESSSVRPPFA